jgi:hypothetical protein
MLSRQEEEAERRATFENDRKVLEQRGSTFHQHGMAQADELSQGRFAAIGSPTVIGAKPSPSTQYPAASPSHQVSLPAEEPLGFSVNDLEPSANHLPPVEETCAPAGAAAAAGNLPPASAQCGDAGAPLSQQDEDQ